MAEGACLFESPQETDGMKVLVVDDDAHVRNFYREVMEEIGCLVEEASDGQAAIDCFRANPPDLVLLDLVMPGIDGFETCRILRRMEQGRTVPILVVTGLQETAAIHRAYDAGATDFIAKPVQGALLAYRALFLLRTGRTFSALLRNEAHLRLLRTAIDSLPIGLTITDQQGKITYVTPAEAKMHGYRTEELLNRDVRILAPPRLHNPAAGKRSETYAAWCRESVNVRKDGEEFPVQISSVAVHDAEGTFLGVISSCEDISERKRSEALIHQFAYSDALTGLPNRTLLMDRLKSALAVASREQRSVSLLFLDLDNFKDINDTKGHAFGDKVLSRVAERLSACVREADTLARFGGDEFIIVQLVEESENTASRTAQRILDAFRRPLDIDGQRIDVGFSIGIACYPQDVQDLGGLLRSADTAMYRAKALGRHNYQAFAAEMNEEVFEKVALESALRLAMDNGELSVVYQWRWDLHTDSCCGVEALLRWSHPRLGEVSPQRFIPLAERGGQIHALGEWTLRQVCAQARSWALEGLPLGRMAVNISGHQLNRPDFPRRLAEVLTASDLAPAHLELEFSESVLIEDAGKTIETLQALKKMGVQLSIDDFGTGHSSLSYLKHLPVDRIKIDRSFIDGIGHDCGDEAIVKAIITLAHNLNIRVLAKGVETPEQLGFLRDLRCHEVQGGVFGEPLACAEVEMRWRDTAGYSGGLGLQWGAPRT